MNNFRKYQPLEQNGLFLLKRSVILGILHPDHVIDSFVQDTLVGWFLSEVVLSLSIAAQRPP